MHNLEGLASLSAQLADVQSAHDQAKCAFDEAQNSPTLDEESFAYANSLIELSFLKLLVLAEHLKLPMLHAQILADMAAACAGASGFGRVEVVDENRYPFWLASVRKYKQAIAVLAGAPVAQLVTKSLQDLLRNSVYPITDSSLFPAAPAREEEVHRRIEAILKCVFPDLRHKLVLTKPIKNFIPDTGIPSVRTLIEYKFVSSEAECARIADELLADTRGYHSADYEHYLYVIYETIRLKPESEWSALLSECGVPPNTSVIVLSGTPHPRKQSSFLSTTVG